MSWFKHRPPKPKLPKCETCGGRGERLVYSPFRYPSPSVIGYTHIREATRDPYLVRCLACDGSGTAYVSTISS